MNLFHHEPEIELIVILDDDHEEIKKIKHAQNRIFREIAEIRRQLRPKRITHFLIRRMTMLPIAPGFSPEFTATPAPAGTFPAPGNVPVWTSSDTTNAPVTADASGLVATVAIPATATVGATFTLTITYTNADGVVATGTLDQTIVAAPPSDITSFTIAQTA